MRAVVVRSAEVEQGGTVDVRIAGGVVAEIGSRLSAREPDEVIEAHGGALIPGLCDHHVHLHAIAAAMCSVQCGPPAVTGPEALAAALADAGADNDGWVRGVGYTEDVAGLLDAAGLDRFHSRRPVRIQHRSGALWIVNTAGLHALGLAGPAPAGTAFATTGHATTGHATTGHATTGHPGIERDGDSRPTGRLWRADDWLRTRLPRSGPPVLEPVGKQLTRLGITHVTDATPDLDDTAIAAIAAAMASGDLPQHVHLLGAPLDWTPPAGSRGPTPGPYKIIIADSDLPDLSSLTERIAAAHAAGRAVAVHCVTREALLLLLAALADAGVRPGDRIEHAALVPAELIPALRQQGLTVVSQPGFISQRGDDYRRDVPASEHADLYRARSLLDGGVRYAASSDAPYGPLDPWAVIAAGTDRATPAGKVIGPGERISGSQAIAGYLSHPDQPGGPARPVTVGSPADLVLLRVPLAEALAAPSADLVAATFIKGSRCTTAASSRR
jgi:predicted amidohydrolase YtcJ